MEVIFMQNLQAKQYVGRSWKSSQEIPDKHILRLKM